MEDVIKLMLFFILHISYYVNVAWVKSFCGSGHKALVDSVVEQAI